MKPFELLETVVDEATFLTFVEALIRDRLASIDAGRDEGRTASIADEQWENTTIEGFLEAAAAWATTTRFGATQNLEGVGPWRKFATFLYLGKIYE